MASGFFALFEDIATLMDDVATMGKVAAKKTTSILGDDLAVKSNQASGFVASRELPVIWAILKGSLINKAIILPVAFLLSIFLPQAIIVLLLLGGAYLGFEGFEKVYEWIFHKKEHKKDNNPMEIPTKKDILEFEKVKIKSAIKTDFVLSLEVVIVALGVVRNTPVLPRIIIVALVAIGATIGVYAIVAVIVRLDDIGYKIKYFSKNKFLNKIGDVLIHSLPSIVRILMVVGTIAMFTVSGGIYHHNLSVFHHFLPQLPSIIAEIIIGLIVGGIAYFIVEVFLKVVKLFLKK